MSIDEMSGSDIADQELRRARVGSSGADPCDGRADMVVGKERPDQRQTIAISATLSI